ncbi:hypothetical protein ACFV4N_14695 [Actinosynnema sp. NPDC059797]
MSAVGPEDPAGTGGAGAGNAGTAGAGAGSAGLGSAGAGAGAGSAGVADGVAGNGAVDPAPRFELRAGLPGWVLRAAIAVTCGAVAGVLAGVGVEALALVLYLVLAVTAAAIPASAAAALLIGYPAAAVVFATDGAPWPVVLALVVLLHLVHVLCAYAAVVPLKARIHPEALAAPAKRFVFVQLSVFALAGLVTLLPAGRTEAPVEVIGLAGAVVLVLATVLLLRRGS